jgi:hypothetical protein
MEIIAILFCLFGSGASFLPGAGFAVLMSILFG